MTAVPAGTYENTVTGTAKVLDADGNDVTAQFKVVTRDVPLEGSACYAGNSMSISIIFSIGVFSFHYCNMLVGFCHIRDFQIAFCLRDRMQTEMM